MIYNNIIEKKWHVYQREEREREAADEDLEWSSTDYSYLYHILNSTHKQLASQ